MWHLAILLLVLCVASPVGATTYYVATTGSNSNNGTSEATPKLTMQACVDLMIAGDTCYVRGGTYSATGVRFRVSGTSAAPIRLLNYPNESPVLACTGTTLEANSILIMHGSGFRFAIGWLEIGGFEVRNCRNGFTIYNLHDTSIHNMWIHDAVNQGILGNGTRIRIDRSIFNHNGRFATAPTSIFEHGIYMNGTAITITNCLIYDSLNFNIQINGSGSANYDPNKHAGPEFARTDDWIVAHNTFAYSKNEGAIVVWGSNIDNLRIENNIFYENGRDTVASSGQGVNFFSSRPSNVTIRNNHFYGSGSGAQAAITSSGSALAQEGVHYTQSGNVVNVSAPAFVDGGSNALPASPNFRLTASAPVNICRTSEFLNNSTCVVGAFKTIATPTATITANKITLTFPMSTAVPIQISSATGVSINCTGANCPGSYSVGAAARVTSSDSQVEVTVVGCTNNNCANNVQNWTISYNSSTGSWSGFDNIGPYPGLHQKIFSFTNLAVTNNDSGGGPDPTPGTPCIHYLFDEGTGTTATNTGSCGAGENGTLVGGATFAANGGVVLTAQSGQYISIPHGSVLDPSAQNMTIAFGVEIAEGVQSLARTYFGSPLGTNQRFYVSTLSGTARIGVQTSNDAAGTELVMNSGRNHFCLTVNATSDVVTLHHNGIASVQPGGVKSVTSYALAGNWELGRLAGVANGPGGTFTDFLYYESVEDCNAIYQVWNATPPPPPSGAQFGQPAYRFQSVYLTAVGANPTNFGTAINQAKTVVKGGAVAVAIEAYCEDVANCNQDAFRLEFRQNGAGSWLQVPDMETETHIWMWGADTNQLLNNGTTTARLSAGSCTFTNGGTVLASAQVPVVDLPQDGCTVNRYIVRIGQTASGYYELRLSQQNGTAFTGTVNTARIDVIDSQASAGP